MDIPFLNLVYRLRQGQVADGVGLRDNILRDTLGPSVVDLLLRVVNFHLVDTLLNNSRVRAANSGVVLHRGTCLDRDMPLLIHMLVAGQTPDRDLRNCRANGEEEGVVHHHNRAVGGHRDNNHQCSSSGGRWDPRAVVDHPCSSSRGNNNSRDHHRGDQVRMDSTLQIIIRDSNSIRLDKGSSRGNNNRGRAHKIQRIILLGTNRKWRREHMVDDERKRCISTDGGGLEDG